MIGQFWFAESDPGGHVILHLSWDSGEVQGTVGCPQSVVLSLQQRDIPVRAEDERMHLSFALGYAVMISTLSETPLTLTGDSSAWPSAWGSLKSRTVLNFHRAQAH